MPNRLDILITPQKQIRDVTNTAVNLHGFIMQSVTQDYADKLHDNSLKLYSQHGLLVDVHKLFRDNLNAILIV